MTDSWCLLSGIIEKIIDDCPRNCWRNRFSTTRAEFEINRQLYRRYLGIFIEKFRKPVWLLGSSTVKYSRIAVQLWETRSRSKSTVWLWSSAATVSLLRWIQSISNVRALKLIMFDYKIQTVSFIFIRESLIRGRAVEFVFTGINVPGMNQSGLTREDWDTSN